MTFLKATLVFAGLIGSALAQGNNPFITADDHGIGSITFPGLPVLNMPGILAADPGPGGLPSALTYNLLGPPAVVAGDLIVQQLIGASLELSEVIRFNPDETAPGYTSSFVFYSGIGFPASSYANTFTLLAFDHEVFYIPTLDQPGYVPGFSVTYHFVSDPPVDAAQVPEPASGWLVVIAIGLAAIALAAPRTASPRFTGPAARG